MMFTTLAIAAAVSSSALETAFHSPAHDAKPHTWYHMMNGNVTYEGITADFEALAKAGVGGVQMFDAGCDIPAGPIAFNSPDWYNLMRHAAREARRLGLEICIPNCSGWSSSGGPWITPDRAMKMLTTSSCRVKGGRVEQKLTRDMKDNGFYEDIAVLAYPTPCSDADYSSVTAQLGRTSFTLSSEKPFTANGVTFDFDWSWGWCYKAQGRVEISDDGTTFRTLDEFPVTFSQSGANLHVERYLAFSRRVTARAVRVTFSNFWPDETKIRKGFTVARLERRLGLNNLPFKTFALRAEVPRDARAGATPDELVAKDAVRDLTSRMRKDGTLVCDLPEGDWTILRVGYKCNGKKNHPASDHGCGLEVDKLSVASIDYHIDQYVAKLVEHLGPLAGKVESGFNNILVDSYEIGSQNWTQGFEREFAKRRGYSLVPYLPIFDGCIIGSVDESERFLEDFRRVIADVFAESYSKGLADKCHSLGLKLSNEAYGNCPADNLQYGHYADIPMGEVWSNLSEGLFGVNEGNARYCSFLAHVWGRKYAGMEAFTAAPAARSGRWLVTPFAIKAQGDRLFTRGITRFIFHRFTHQPWVKTPYLPGMTMGRWGMHFDRTQPWWPYVGEWLTYVTRCQSMLQQGRFVADALFFCGDAAPNQGGSTDGTASKPEGLQGGYAWDFCTTDALMWLRVDKGEVVVPGGVRYRLLILPSVDTMSVEVLQRINDLLDDGAKICVRQLPTRAQGLMGYPAADAKVAALTQRLRDKGAIMATPEEALRQLGIAPDFTVKGVEYEGKNGMSYIHRTNDAGLDWYFVAMPNHEPVTCEASFRVTGRVPEIWDAEANTIAKAHTWRVEGGRTVVTLNLRTSGSAFVVFRSTDASALPRERVDKVVKTVAVEGVWDVAFPHGFLPNPLAVGAPEHVTFASLVDWKDHALDGVKYFSGVATYAKKLAVAQKPQAGERLLLDLGMVKHFAEVTVDGTTYAPLWKPPFVVDVTDAASDGTLDVSVKVANQWANRLIGDDRQFADDCTWRGKVMNGTKEIGVTEIPAWVKQGRKSPTGRCTFTTRKHWDKNDALESSGILGPVRLITVTDAP